jgi:hypothetical protein
MSSSFSSVGVAHPSIQYPMPEEWDGPDAAEATAPTDPASTDPAPTDPDVMGAGLSPDALIAYCQSRLDSIDGQMTDSFNEQQQSAETITQIDKVTALIKQYDGSAVTDPDTCKLLESNFQGLILSLRKSDPGCTELPAMITAYNSMVYSGTGGAAFLRAKDPAAPPDPTEPDFIDKSTYPPDTSTTQGDNDLGDTELQGYAQTLSDAAAHLNSDSELQMVQLQSLMSQRQTAISLTTNLVQSLGDQENKIADNIGH